MPARSPRENPGSDVKVAEQRRDEPVAAELCRDGVVGVRDHLGKRAARTTRTAA